MSEASFDSCCLGIIHLQGKNSVGEGKEREERAKWALGLWQQITF